jgi:hypothetical protein
MAKMRTVRGSHTRDGDGRILKAVEGGDKQIVSRCSEIGKNMQETGTLPEIVDREPDE